MPRILVVDDEPAVRSAVSAILSGVGFDVNTVSDGETALETSLADPHDLIILDLCLPGLDGVEVCRRLRKESLVPILMLTGLGEELDKVLGLEACADDYLTKPFGALELLARVRVLLRRAQKDSGVRLPQSESWAIEEPFAAARLRINNLEIDLIGRKVLISGKPVKLSHREFDLLSYLSRHPGQPFSAAHLLREVWGYRDTTDTRTVLVHIRWLRQKMERDASVRDLIETIKGKGYRLRV